MSLHVLADERMTTGKAAVVVSKKVHKSAVVRNRIRRRIYEIIRTHQPRLNKPCGLVFTVYSADVAMMPAADVDKAVTDLLTQAKLL
jgi:ribonuclease P protein component